MGSRHLFGLPCVCVSPSLSLRWSAAAAAFSFPKGPYSAALQQRERTAPVNNTACESRREAVGGGGRYGCGLCSKRPWCKGRLKLFRMPVGIQLRRGLVLVPPLFDTLRKKQKQFSSFFIYFSCCPCVREFGRSHTRKSGQQLLVSPSFRPATHRCAPSPFELVQPPPNPSTRGGKKELRVCVCCVRVCRSSLVVLRHGYTEKCVNRRRAVIYSSASIMETCTLATTT